MYTPYIDVKYYKEKFDEEIAQRYLIQASREIDVLTFNRIVGRFDRLTEYQKEVVQEVCCEHASFISKNEDLLNTYLSSYSINGVSMSFGESWNLHIDSGVIISKNLYERLSSTGLCYKGFYV